ncbi:MAG TPA: PIN domain-containing protein [Chloroflexota bacterium]|nr:PIN domain-containing protein [Chloroflexota bacterium]
MTIAGGRPVFIDTNVLVYATVESAPFHAVARFTLDGLHQTSSQLWVSRQVLREYLAVLSRPQAFTNPLTPAQLVGAVRRFIQQFQVADDGPHVTEELLKLINQYAVGGRQIHDANIVATMRAYRVSTLLTHNEDDFSRFLDLIEILPLRINP